MQVFHYDVQSGTKGEFIGHFPYCHAVSNPDMVIISLPVRKNQDWVVGTRAQYLDCSPMIFDVPVCFCLGELTCGTDSSWNWVVLLPKDYNE